MRLFLFLFIAGFTFLSADELKPFLGKYCFDCHDADVQKGDLDLTKIYADSPLVKNLQVWRHVLHMVREGDMPPKDKKNRPLDSERKEFISKLSTTLKGFDYSKIKDPGSEPARRLSNLEYERTVSSLFKTDLVLKDKLNADLRLEDGYSKNAETLFVQTSVLEKFYAAAEYAVAKAIENHSSNTQQLKEFLGDGSRNSALQAVRNFMNRAYRRPASKKDLAAALSVFNSVVETQGVKKAVMRTYEFILSSPRFLMKLEERGTSDRISHWDMASRLSYFLWGTLPDETLFKLAAAGQLHNPEVLKSQVERMMKVPEFSYIGESMGAQWLKYSEVGVRNRPDPIDNPFMTDSLYRAMFDESSLFFTYLLKKNKKVSELLTADYTFLNEELARFYRIGGIKGPHMRPVRLTTRHRGGILSHSSILMVTSHPDRSSPILRGNWILTDLLGTPPPPPPKNVDELDEEEEDVEKLLKKHSSQKQCAGCHSKIDPLGIGLNNFDHFGRYRKKRPVAAKFEDGTPFTGLQGLKEILLKKRLTQMERRIIEKTLSFALGRQLQYFDETAVREILKKMNAKEAGLRDMVVAVVQSYPFRYNRK